MVIYQTLRLDGFFSLSSVEIPLHDQGLVLLTGINGSGKTAVAVEGLYYALYGYSFEYGKLPGDKVVNRRTGQMLVELNLQVSGTDYLIRRARNHSVHGTIVSLYQFDPAKEKWEDRSLGTSAATQGMIDDIVGITAEGFCSSVVFSTDLLRFPDYPDSAKKKIIDDLIHLSEADVALGGVKDARLKAIREKELVDRDLARTTSQIQSIEEEAAKLQEVGEFPWEDDLVRLQDELDQHVVLTLDLEPVPEFTGLLKEAEEMRNRHRSETKELEDELREWQSHLGRGRRRRDSLENDLADTSCPTCRREWGKEHQDTIRKQIDEVKEGLATIEAAIQETAALLDPIRDRHRQESAESDRVLQEMKRKVEAVKSANQRHMAMVSESERQGDRIRAALQKVRMEKAKWDAVLGERGSRLEKLKSTWDEAVSARDELSAKVADQAQALDDLQVLMECFGPKGARVLLLQSAIPTLNQAAQDAQEIIAPGIDIRFCADDDTKGNLRVEVDNANGAGQYHGNSAGERRKVDLVVLFALMSLRRIKTNFFSVDEAFEKLSEDSQVAVASYLKTLSRTTSTIFMVNHTATTISQAADQVWHMDHGAMASRTDLRNRHASCPQS